MALVYIIAIFMKAIGKIKLKYLNPTVIRTGEDESQLKASNHWALIQK